MGTEDPDAIGRSFANFSFDSVARYTILEHLGTGGMGIVFLAQRETSGVHDSVVLKTIRDMTPETLDELRQEANLATRLRHPNIVRTYGLETVPYDELPAVLQRSLASVGEPDVEPERPTPAPRRPSGVAGRRPLRRGGRGSQPEIVFKDPKKPPKKREGPGLSFIVMDYIDGLDLLGPPPPDVRRGLLIPTILGAYIVSRVARALEYAHNVLIHRDISPGNVLIDSLGMPLLSDFGVAVVSGSDGTPRAGKLSYIAPEILGGADFDARVDVYSLGMMAYLLASGIQLQRVPKTGTLDTRLATILTQVDAGFPSLSEALVDVDESYSQIVQRMIAADPEDRYQHASTIASDIEQKVLYAKGFGPTNKSLAAYIEMFERGFDDYSFDHVDQLSFLRDDKGEVQLERPLVREMYKPAGQQLLNDRPEGHTSIRVRELEHERKGERAAAAKPTAVAQRPMLKIRFGDNCMESIELRGELTIGRSAQASTVVLVDASASRRHARIQPVPEGALLEDLESGNGTYVGERRIQRILLENGGRFRIGGTTLYYVNEPRLARPVADHQVGVGPLPAGLVDRMLFALEVPAGSQHHLQGLWSELATGAGLADRAGYLLAQALFEACGMMASVEEPLLLQVLRERAALRFLLWSSPASKRAADTLLSFKQVLGHRAGEGDASAEQFAVTLVRQVFDRIDFYADDGLLLLSKGI